MAHMPIHALSGRAALAAFLILATVGCDRYQYLQRGGDSVRIDKFTGRMSVLRVAAGGGAVWVAVRTAEEVATEKQRCETRPLPSSEARRVDVAPIRAIDEHSAYDVANRSSWYVSELRVQYPRVGTQITATRVQDAGAATQWAIANWEVSPGQDASFSATAPGFVGDFTISGVLGRPGDCKPL